MQHFPVQTQTPFAQQYRIVEVSNPLLAGNALFQPASGTFYVPLQSHHIVQTDGQVLLSQEVPVIGASPLQVDSNSNNQNNIQNSETNHGTLIQQQQSQQNLLARQSLEQTQLLEQIQCQQPISHSVSQIQFDQTNNIITPPQTILVHDQIGQPVLVEEATIMNSQLQQQVQPQQQQQQFVVVSDVGANSEVVEFTDAGTQTILSALSQGETPAISINGDIVGYVNCAEIKSDGAIVFTIGGNCQQKSDITNFLELIDKKKNHRDAQSWFFDSVVATQAMQALINKRPDTRSSLPLSAIRRQVH